MLLGYLPFDGGDTWTTFRLVKEGYLDISSHLSPKSNDLIHRILPNEPENRITMEDIWFHSLLNEHDTLHRGIRSHYIKPTLLSTDQECGCPLAGKEFINSGILGCLQLLCKNVDLEVLVGKLMSPR